MRFALGMDNREIARALGRTDGATKVLLHRAIKQLEGIVAEPEEAASRHEQPTPQTSRPAARRRSRPSTRPRTSRCGSSARSST